MRNRIYQDILAIIPKWTKIVLIAMLFLSIFKQYIANDIPIYVQINEQSYFPVLAYDLHKLGFENPKMNYLKAKKNEVIEYQLSALIPYGPNTIDNKHIHYKSPFDYQPSKTVFNRHWLGTDQIGRDVLAGVIHGTSTALMVAFFSSMIALVIGLIFGLVAGYYQDDRLKMSVLSVLVWICWFVVMMYVGFYHRRYNIINGHYGHIIIGLSYLLLSFYLIRYIDRKFIQKLSFKKYAIFVDLFIMRLMESYKSIPLLLLVFAILSMFQTPSLSYVIWIIGLTRWPTITRYVRAEVLHIRRQDYITAAVASGIPDFKILWNHTLPNAMSPIMVTLAFSMSSAILLEATLSFLGIGIPSDAISWGSMIQSARIATNAWWVALFPGLAIFLLVLTLNKITDAINQK